MSQTVRSAQELVEALASGVDEIDVEGSLRGMPMITLAPGVKLRGGTLSFGAKGVRLTRDNELDGVTVLTEDDEVAILNDTSVADLGTLTLREVRTTGQVLLLAADAVRNLYDGSLRHASFDAIATHGDGSVGVQVSKPLPILEISGDLSTDGGEGQSLVKGVQLSLKAIALSVKPGAKVGAITVGGQVRTSGENVITIELEGEVGRIDIAQGVTADGAGSDGIHVRGEVPGLDAITVHARHGRELVRTDS